MTFVYTIGDIVGLIMLALVALFFLFLGGLYVLAWVLENWIAPIELAITRLLNRR
jgi:hypothetical protein